MHKINQKRENEQQYPTSTPGCVSLQITFSVKREGSSGSGSEVPKWVDTNGDKKWGLTFCYDMEDSLCRSDSGNTAFDATFYYMACGAQHK